MLQGEIFSTHKSVNYTKVSFCVNSIKLILSTLVPKLYVGQFIYSMLWRHVNSTLSVVELKYSIMYAMLSKISIYESGIGESHNTGPMCS